MLLRNTPGSSIASVSTGHRVAVAHTVRYVSTGRRVGALRAIGHVIPPPDSASFSDNLRPPLHRTWATTVRDLSTAHCTPGDPRYDNSVPHTTHQKTAHTTIRDLSTVHCGTAVLMLPDAMSIPRG
eukprot:3400373-Rhodomonas_salina.2